MALIEKILNANVYMDDVNFVGRATEVDLASVKIKTTEHQTLAMVGPLELFQGLEKLECKIKWASFNYEMLAKLVPTRAVKLTIRVAQQAYAQSSVAYTDQVRAVMVGRMRETTPQTVKAGEGSIETTFTIDYFKKTVGGYGGIAGADVLEIDVPNYIYKVNGEDIYADVRAALGL